MRGRRRERHRFGNLGRWLSTEGTTAAATREVAGASDSGLRVVLWDTRHGGAFKDFAGGYGVGQFRGKGPRAKIIEYFYRNDFRSPPLAYGYLAAGLQKLGHTVAYSLEETPPADVYVFNPALMTLPYELEVMRRLNETAPKTKLLAVGTVASTMPESFAGINCRVLKGEPEQLIPKFDEALAAGEQQLSIGTVADLDTLPFPDWSVFPYWQFRVGYDFWKFPTAYVQSSRGCTLSCTYCPYIILENKVRTRAPERVVAEIRRNIDEYGFESFKFRDPLFGAKRKHAEELAERIGKLPRKIQFSVESRIELLSRDVLTMLRDVGLTSVTVGIETPSRETLVKYKRAPIKDDKQSQFVAMCRALGIRVIAGFMIGFHEDTRQTIRAVLRYAKQVDPFVANFNVCTPYPGTGFIDEIASQIESRDWSRYDVYTPNLKYEHLTSDEVAEMHQHCFRQYYFRWAYLKDNWRFMFPRLHKLTSRFLSPAAVTAPEPAPANPLKVISASGEASQAAPPLVQLNMQAPQRRSA
ncbi:MAG: B12-binding domain-containing radical SAM protein [Planctomycetia bacterium]|nr:B12-binding domain-containing radical SAM protein [Planctomycetia bacterium]